MVKIKSLLPLTAYIAAGLLSVATVSAQEAKTPLVGHVFYGLMNIANNDPDIVEGDFDMPIFGVDAQQSLGGKIFTYGFETGALFSIDSDIRHFSASSGSGDGKVAISVELNSFLIDYFAGGYLSFEPAKWICLSVGAGPLLIWSQWETDPEASTADDAADQSDSGFGMGIYARAGLDILLTETVGLTIGARINETTLRLEYATVEVEVEGWQYYCGLAFYF